MYRRAFCLLSLFAGFSSTNAAEIPLPKVIDDRLKIELVAAEPDIVTPTGIAVDARGRVLCIENHTHFPKPDYVGEKTDRIKLFEDTNGDRRADKITIFYEGGRDTMNLAACHDGSFYVATRSEIFRLRDSDNDGRADERKDIVKLETEGNYPHNGLSGFDFDLFDHLYFCLGENLGAPYKLVGTDGSHEEGGGEGGSIYRCKLDGSSVERLATGFWNPFHLCLDTYGRIFTVDNDPDWRPPCRLLHVVPDGDYGYRYDLGRRGIHPLTSWFGELPGTLGMVAGTAEAPSAVLSYDSDNLPTDYRHDLITTSWSVHALERFRLKRVGASFKSLPETIVRGGEEFRPVGLALAPDGSLYFSDWVERSYNVHGRGRIWRLSRADEVSPRPSEGAESSMISNHRPLRQHAARTLASKAASLKKFLNDPTAEVRATALQALLARGLEEKPPVDLLNDASPDVREVALSHLPVESFDAVKQAREAQSEFERAAAIRRIRESKNPAAAIEFFNSDDAFVQQAARYALADATLQSLLPRLGSSSDNVRLNIAILLRGLDNKESESVIPDLLTDSDFRVRFVALKWITEERLRQWKPQVLAGLQSEDMTPALFDATLSALELLSDSSPRSVENELQKITASILREGKLSPAVAALALRKVQSVETPDFDASGTGALSVEELSSYTSHEDASVRLEAVRTLREGKGDKNQRELGRLATDRKLPARLRAEAVVGLSQDNAASRKTLLSLAGSEEPSIRNEALRSLQGAQIGEDEKKIIQAIGSPLAKRLIDPEAQPEGRPKPEDTLAWLHYSTGGDAEAGERIFFHPRGALCSVCHRVSGRGGAVGPDLSAAGRLGVNRLLESIVTPSREMAPRYVPWVIVSSTGEAFTGVLVGERGDFEFYADAKGKLTSIDHTHIAQSVASKTSIMPEGLVNQLTDQELRDLMAYLQGLR